jgi:hypothetical protein
MNDNRMNEVKEIIKETEESYNLSKVEEMIKDNKLSFDYAGTKYRIHLLNDKEKDELDVLRRKKINSMLQEKDEQGNYVYLSEKKLIQILKERGDIDIDKVNDEIKKLDAEEGTIRLKLGESISKNEGEIILKTYHQQIEEILSKKKILIANRTDVLGFSLENQFLGYVAKIMAYLSLDKLIESKWERAFKNIDEFENYQDEQLKETAMIYAMLLQNL